MTWEEIARAIAGGGDPDEHWDCLYLLLPELNEMLAYAKDHASQPFVYPLLRFAAHTGARRSEIMRCLVTDIDWQGQAVLLREKKRARGKLTTRRVPLTPFLKKVLEDWLKVHPGGQHLFCQAGVIGRSKKRSRTTGHKGEKTRASGLKARMAGVRKRDQLAPAPLSKPASVPDRRAGGGLGVRRGLTMRTRRAILSGVASLLFLAGCGGGGTGVTVTGQLVRNGMPYTHPEADEVSVDFIAGEADGRVFSVLAGPADGSFDLSAATGQKIPAGHYTVGVTHKKYMQSKDLLKSEFSGRSSPLKCELPDGKVRVVIDLGTKAVEVR